MNDRLYLLEIKLLEIEPEIWRRFVVPASITLDRLHDVIQMVMGWQDYHLFEFTINKKTYTEDPESEDQGAESGKYRLEKLIKQKGQTFAYTYDFGDDWRHEITLKDSNYSNPDLQSQVICLEGARACPPEDIGGVPGYYNFLEALVDPNHEEHEGYIDWYGGWFDSEEFDIEIVNFELMKYLRWSRDRHLVWGDIL